MNPQQNPNRNQAPPNQAAPPPQPAPGQPPMVSVAAPASKTKTPAAAASNPNSAQNFLEIAEIRDGVVIMSDGSFRSVVMAKAINFDLMSQQEQEAIEYSYQNMLNSLTFTIQIFMRTQRVDLQSYIEKLDKIRSEHDNMLLSLLMEDYISYIDALAQQTNIMDKKFYVVVPFSEIENQKMNSLDQNKSFFIGLAALLRPKQKHVMIDEGKLENAKTELRNRVQSVMSGLQQCGVQGLPLDTQELIELYYDTYNPDTATHQQLKNFNSLTASVITKGEGRATQPQLNKELQG
ncbi:MAG: hypothetical protein ACREGA_02975 [Candidatus Saccharimonadales bacterium]